MNHIRGDRTARIW